MNRQPPTQEAFDKLLAWLDPDREEAGETYERIHARLIKIFGCHGSLEPDRLADETIDRVTSKIDWLIENYVGNPLLYFCGVARNLLKEDLRTRTNMRIAPTPPDVNEDSEKDKQFDCLDQCMEELPQTNRRLVLAYYEQQGHAKITQRRKLADELGITLQALRLRVFHMRLRLRECMEICLSGSPSH